MYKSCFLKYRSAGLFCQRNLVVNWRQAENIYDMRFFLDRKRNLSIYLACKFIIKNYIQIQ